MKKRNCKMLVAGVLLVSTLTCLAAKREDVDFSIWRINGTRVSATAAQLNTLGPLSSLVLTNVTKSTGAVTASGANNLVTPTAAVTLNTFSLEYLDHATNAQTVLVVTNVTCAITPNLASNAVVAVTVVGGDAVVTNITVRR